MKQITDYINEHKYIDILQKEREEAFNRIKKVIPKVLNTQTDKLDETIVSIVSLKDKDIEKYIDNDITVRLFLNKILRRKSVEISDSVAREEVIEGVCKIINTIKKDSVNYNDLMDAYMLCSNDYTY